MHSVGTYTHIAFIVNNIATFMSLFKYSGFRRYLILYIGVIVIVEFRHRILFVITI